MAVVHRLLIGGLMLMILAQRAACQQGPTCNLQLDHIQLSEVACDVAEKICLGDTPASCLIRQIRELDKMTERCGSQKSDALFLRQDMTESILASSLEIDGFLAEVDSEVNHIQAVRNKLSDKRDTKLSLSNLGSNIATSGGAVGSALQLGGDAAQTAGNWLSTVFGGGGSIFGFLGYFQQNGPSACFPAVSTHCPKLEKPKPAPANDDPDVSPACPNTRDEAICDAYDPPGSCSPSMLYAVLYPHECNNREHMGFHSDYPRAIERYLDEPPPNRPISRRKALIDSWGNQIAELRAGLSSNAEPRRLTISELDERANRLADLRATVYIMKRDLSRLARELAVASQCSPPEEPPESTPAAEPSQ
jgi:hypothetical protein